MHVFHLPSAHSLTITHNAQIMSESLLEKKNHSISIIIQTHLINKETVAKGTDMWRTVQNL